jgi:hypothetical protein
VVIRSNQAIENAYRRDVLVVFIFVLILFLFFPIFFVRIFVITAMLLGAFARIYLGRAGWFWRTFRGARGCWLMVLLIFVMDRAVAASFIPIWDLL